VCRAEYEVESEAIFHRDIDTFECDDCKTDIGSKRNIAERRFYTKIKDGKPDGGSTPKSAN